MIAGRWWLAAWSTLLTLSGCSIERHGLNAPPTSLDPGAVDAGADARGSGDASSDGGDGPGTDAEPAPDAGLDAGPPTGPTTPVELAVSGGYAAHPAIAWDAETGEFVVAYFADDGSGAHVSIARMPPGGAPGAETRITGSRETRRSLSIAPSAAGVAVGWLEEAGGTWELVVETTPSGPAGRWGPAQMDADHDDLQLVWREDVLHAAVRAPNGGGERLAWIRFDPAPVHEADFAWSGGFGEIGRIESRTQPAVVAGFTTELWQLHDAGWQWTRNLWGLGDPLEGDVAELAGGSYLAVWSDQGTSGTPMSAIRIAADGSGGYYQDGAPRLLGWNGPDPSVDSWGDRVVLAWCDITDGDRPLGLALLAADGTVVVNRCDVPAVRPSSNDPDVACGGGWCGVVWMEADARDQPYVTRVMQVPVVDDPAVFCP